MAAASAIGQLTVRSGKTSIEPDETYAGDSKPAAAVALDQLAAQRPGGR